MRTWHHPEEKVGLPDGVWKDEPDKAQWVDPSTDLDCLIVRNHSGVLCGYVGVPPEHPAHGHEYNDLNVAVHGGLTYANSCNEDAEEGHGICHIPEPGRPDDVWWFGFDTGHHTDYVPGMADEMARIVKSSKELSDLAWRGFTPADYKTFDYVKTEVEALATQLASIPSVVGW